jgi:hypothetical protein
MYGKWGIHQLVAIKHGEATRLGVPMTFCDKPMGFLLNDPQRFPHKNGGVPPVLPFSMGTLW